MSLPFITLTTTVKRLQKMYGVNKIDRQLVLDMLHTIDVYPYYDDATDEMYLPNYMWAVLSDNIDDYKRGAPVNEIFNIGI